VDFTLDGTATPGEDYATPAAYRVTIPAGAASATFSITPINDGVVEDPETVVATLAGGSGYDVGAASATGTIADYVPDTVAPTAPVLSVATTSTTAKLTWGASSDNVGVVAYDVYRGGTLVASRDGGTTTYTDSGLASKTSYTWSVVARDAAGNASAASNAVTVATKIAAPTNLTATRVKISGSRYGAKLAWTDTTVGETGFHVYSSRDGVNWTLLATTGANVTSYTTGQLATGTWYFKVAGFDANGDSDGVVKSLAI
jgi:chitodextrinase